LNLSPISFDLILEKKFHLMEITQTEIEEIKKFVSDLNKESAPIIVEGKKDTSALKSIGVMGKIFEFNKFQGMTDFSDHVSKFEKIIILFDKDRQGSTLVKKSFRILDRRTKLDLRYKSRLGKITKGKVKCVEELKMYEDLI